MVGAVAPVLLALAAATHDIGFGPGDTYSPTSLRVAAGDTVRWQANDTHPLVFEAGSGPFNSVQTRTLGTPGKIAFYCDVHGAPGGVGMSGTVTVNAPPAIAIERLTATPRAGAPVSFRAGASDPDGDPVTVDWDLDGDGTFERVNAGATASASYAAGQHTVHARANDDLAASATASHTFTVPRAGGGAPGGSNDTAAPSVEMRAPKSIRAKKLRRRGVKLTLTASEDGRLVAQLRNRGGRRLGRTTAQVHAGQATVIHVRARRAKAGRLTLRIVAIDLAGNRRALTRALKVR